MWGSSSSGGAAGAALAGIPGGAWSPGGSMVTPPTSGGGTASAAKAAGGSVSKAAVVGGGGYVPRLYQLGVDLWAIRSCDCVEDYWYDHTSNPADSGMMFSVECTPELTEKGKWTGGCACVHTWQAGAECGRAGHHPLGGQHEGGLFEFVCDRREPPHQVLREQPYSPVGSPLLCGCGCRRGGVRWVLLQQLLGAC